MAAHEEGNRISAGFLKVEGDARRTQALKTDIKILNMKEEDCEDMMAIIAMKSINKEVLAEYNQL